MGVGFDDGGSRSGLGLVDLAALEGKYVVGFKRSMNSQSSYGGGGKKGCYVGRRGVERRERERIKT
jgi:hypothetical protein